MNTDEVMSKHLAMEFSEHNNYIRTFFTIGITWYTFFVTSNLVVMGLFLSKILEGKSFPCSYLLLASCLFVFVNVLGVLACRVFARQFAKREKRLLIITSLLNKASGNNGIELPLSLSAVNGFINLVVGSLVGLLLFWATLPMLFFFVKNG